MRLLHAVVSMLCLCDMRLGDANPAGLQVTLVYQPPPSAGGTRVVKDMTVAVQSGLAHMPHLPQQAVTGRSCFNVGLPIHRTVIPAAILTLRDRYAVSGISSHTFVCPRKICLQGAKKHPPPLGGSLIKPPGHLMKLCCCCCCVK